MGENEKRQKVEEILQMDLDSIYIGNLNTVDSDLVFPKEGKYGSRFEWESGEERFIDRDGTVHRPLHGMGNRKVHLTVKACYEGVCREREFTATVLQEAKETVITKLHRVEIEIGENEKAHLPSVVIADTADGRRMAVPVSWEEPKDEQRTGSAQVKGHVKDCNLEAVAEIRWVCERKGEAVPERKAEFFPIGRVRLLEGTLHYEYQQRMIEYLLGIDDDQMLYNFRVAAGLDTRGAEPMTGWDEDSCKLKGHTSGHYMSGLALAWGATGDARFLEKINHMVDGLEECQEAMARSGKYHRGFLSAYSEEQFDLLEEFTLYPEIWAPYYTLDKIMSGLYDCMQIAGSEKAGKILSLMGDWCYDRLSRLPKATLDQMWSMYIAGEFGGMLGTMVKLYQVTGKESHLKTAYLFENEKLFYPMEQNCDTLEDMHANQHIPQIMGAMDLFETTGEGKYWRIGKNFWEIVTGGHIYCIGGVGETEMFHRAGTTCSYLTEKAAESCASYNMLRLTAQLFAYSLDGQMMDYYDNTLRNHILTSCSHTADGGTTYFMPLGPGECKEYSTTENTCCHGTGMESRFRYMENIYAHDEESVYVNLLIDSALSGDEALEIRSEEEEGKVRIRCLGEMKKNLKIHIPSWARENYQVYVNEERLENAGLQSNGYLCVGKCHAGDEVELRLPMEFREIENGEKKFVNLAYGPYILAALSDKKDFIELPRVKHIRRSGKFRFEADGVELRAFPRVDLEPYHVYFKREAKA